MKLSFTLAFIILTICLINTAEATEKEMKKHVTEVESCPRRYFSDNACFAYAAQKAKTQKYNTCHTFSIENSKIHWFTCGHSECGSDQRKLQDLGKSYPDCCPRCVKIK